jgi:hypothetical protein
MLINGLIISKKTIFACYENYLPKNWKKGTFFQSLIKFRHLFDRFYFFTCIWNPNWNLIFMSYCDFFSIPSFCAIRFRSMLHCLQYCSVQKINKKASDFHMLNKCIHSVTQALFSLIHSLFLLNIESQHNNGRNVY